MPYLHFEDLESYHTLQQPGRRTQQYAPPVIADEEPTRTYLSQDSQGARHVRRTFYENLNPRLNPKTARATDQEAVRLDDAYYRRRTANNPKVVMVSMVWIWI
jgi:hypothetical protein